MLAASGDILIAGALCTLFHLSRTGVQRWVILVSLSKICTKAYASSSGQIQWLTSSWVAPSFRTFFCKMFRALPISLVIGIYFSLFAYLDAVSGQHWSLHQVLHLYNPSATHLLINNPYYCLVVPLIIASVQSLLWSLCVIFFLAFVARLRLLCAWIYFRIIDPRRGSYLLLYCIFLLHWPL